MLGNYHHPPPNSASLTPAKAEAHCQVSPGGGFYVTLTDGVQVAVRQTGLCTTTATTTSDGTDSHKKADNKSDVEVDLHSSSSSIRSRSNSGNGGCGTGSGGGSSGSSSGIRHEDLRIGHVIGVGSSAEVRKVKHRETGVIYALKTIIAGTRIAERAVQKELDHVLRCATHPNVVKSYEAYYIDGSLSILMDYMNLGSLQKVLNTRGPFPEDILSGVVKQVLQGLGHLHDHGIIHRDIKPHNLVVNSHGLVKVSDFGLSTVLASVMPSASSIVGTEAYCSPEKAVGNPYGTKSDIWSLGVTIAQLALGVFPLVTSIPPENAESNPFETPLNMFDFSLSLQQFEVTIPFNELLPRIQQWYPHRPVLCVEPTTTTTTPAGPSIIPQEFQAFIGKCMQQQEVDRPTCQQLLEDPWITQFATSQPRVDLKAWFHAALSSTTTSSSSSSSSSTSTSTLIVTSSLISEPTSEISDPGGTAAQTQQQQPQT